MGPGFQRRWVSHTGLCVVGTGGSLKLRLVFVLSLGSREEFWDL